MNRRKFLAASGAVAVGTSIGGVLAAEQKLDRIGIQLYTLRDQMAEDLPRTLDHVAAIGYDEVEFAGYFDVRPLQVLQHLENSGLKAPSAHLSLEVIRDTPQVAIDVARTIGHDYLVLAWLGPDQRQTIDQYSRHAEVCNRFGEQCRDAGIQFAYHNHEFEFQPIDGVLPMEVLLAETDPELVKFEIDIYWTRVARVDPFEYFDAHPGRFPLCHVKDMATDGSIADVGDGIIDFGTVFAASDQAGMQHYFVERDDPEDSLVTAERSFAAVSALRF